MARPAPAFKQRSVAAPAAKDPDESADYADFTDLIFRICVNL
jgi:hypothetical protein